MLSIISTLLAGSLLLTDTTVGLYTIKALEDTAYGELQKLQVIYTPPPDDTRLPVMLDTFTLYKAIPNVDQEPHYEIAGNYEPYYDSVWVNCYIGLGRYAMSNYTIGFLSDGRYFVNYKVHWDVSTTESKYLGKAAYGFGREAHLLKRLYVAKMAGATACKPINKVARTRQAVGGITGTYTLTGRKVTSSEKGRLQIKPNVYTGIK